MISTEYPGAGDTRLGLLETWLEQVLERAPYRLAPASSDASFRRYFRITTPTRSYIAMDAPPPQEDVRPFLQVAELLAEAGVNVPGVHAGDIEQGFLLLDDFGSTLYLDQLAPHSVDALYGDALDTLLRLHAGLGADVRGRLPDYQAEDFHRELELFRDWFLRELLGVQTTADEHRLLDACWAELIGNALEQPQVVVHRDYHSRNLMLTEPGRPGVLDFQDARIGPITYDAVSLLRDCYIAWPEARVQDWASGYADGLRQLGLLEAAVDDALFLRWFDLMGVQRHLKAIGIFARLKLRDGKTGYIKDIPRTLDYVLQAARRHNSLAPFLAFLESRVLPAMAVSAGLSP